MPFLSDPPFPWGRMHTWCWQEVTLNHTDEGNTLGMGNKRQEAGSPTPVFPGLLTLRLLHEREIKCSLPYSTANRVCYSSQTYIQFIPDTLSWER